MFAKWKTFKTLRDKKGSDIILIPFSFHALEQFSRQMPEVSPESPETAGKSKKR